MKTVGIVADDYKLEKFKKELTAKGFTDFKIFPFTAGTSAIKVKVEDKQVAEVKKICHLVEFHFKRGN